jgi:oligopeptide transport system substrate-binding protein
VKNDQYWDRDKVHLKSIDALAVDSETTGLNMYLTGQVDYTEPMPATIVKDLIAQQRPDFTPSPSAGTYMYRLNVTRKPLDDVRVRKALALAVDKQAIVDHVTKAGQIPARSMVPPVLAQYVPYKPEFCGEYNVAEARRLLAEAGYPDGKGFPKLELMLDERELNKAVAQVIQSQWKENLGVDISVRSLEWGAYQAAARRLEYDIARYGWVGDYPDPHTFLKMWVTDGGNNQTGWSNKKYDRLIDLAQREPDSTKRFEYYRQAERILMDELPIIPLYYYVSTFASPPYVKGLHANMHNFHSLKEVRVDAEEKKQFNPRGPFKAPANSSAPLTPGESPGANASPKENGLLSEGAR